MVDREARSTAMVALEVRVSREALWMAKEALGALKRAVAALEDQPMARMSQWVSLVDQRKALGAQ